MYNKFISNLFFKALKGRYQQPRAKPLVKTESESFRAADKP